MNKIKLGVAVLSILAVLSLSLTACNLFTIIQNSGTETIEPVSTETPTETETLQPAVEQDQQAVITYPLVDTDQQTCYDNIKEITCSDTSFTGQDAQYAGASSRYRDNADGTVTDLVTGLMWQQDPGEKMTYEQAVAEVSSFDLADYTDWRLPSIKELYSLILFDGTDVSDCNGSCEATPFIDTRYFNFSYGDTTAGERVIDSQFASSTKYVSTTMNGAETMFGVNFADGRIKGYGIDPLPGQSSGKTFYILYVRGNLDYGQNNFVNGEDGTVIDRATGLVWTQSDSQTGMDWQSALQYCETLDTAGETDWRLPNIKELQSIVDYSRSPDTTASAAIDPLFKVSSITNEAGEVDTPFYWSSTTHVDSSGRGTSAAYIAFGRALGYMDGWIDVHGAGAQRSDPKIGSASDYPEGHGPQGDAIRVDNYVRCVRGGEVTQTDAEDEGVARPQMTVESTGINMDQNSEAQLPSVETPPLAAIQACLNRSAGTTCQFTIPNGTINGVCSQVKQQMICVPKDNSIHNLLP